MSNRLMHVLIVVALLWAYLPAPGPAPGPTPDVQPITEGVAVLIVEETADRQNLPESQLQIFRGTELRRWMDDNKVAHRMWDQDLNGDDLKHEDKGWQDAMSQPRQAVPWIYISNGKTGFSGPLPQTVDATKDLVGRYLP